MSHPRPHFSLNSVFSSKKHNFLQETNVKNVKPVSCAGIRTHNLLNTSLLPQPLDRRAPAQVISVLVNFFRTDLAQTEVTWLRVKGMTTFSEEIFSSEAFLAKNDNIWNRGQFENKLFLQKLRDCVKSNASMEHKDYKNQCYIELLLRHNWHPGRLRNTITRAQNQILAILIKDMFQCQLNCKDEVVCPYFKTRAVIVSQLTVQSLPIPENLGSLPVIFLMNLNRRV